MVGLYMSFSVAYPAVPCFSMFPWISRKTASVASWTSCSSDFGSAVFGRFSRSLLFEIPLRRLFHTNNVPSAISFAFPRSANLSSSSARFTAFHIIEVRSSMLSVCLSPHSLDMLNTP